MLLGISPGSDASMPSPTTPGIKQVASKRTLRSGKSAEKNDKCMRKNSWSWWYDTSYIKLLWLLCQLCPWWQDGPRNQSKVKDDRRHKTKSLTFHMLHTSHSTQLLLKPLIQSLGTILCIFISKVPIVTAWSATASRSKDWLRLTLWDTKCSNEMSDELWQYLRATETSRV